MIAHALLAVIGASEHTDRLHCRRRRRPDSLTRDSQTGDTVLSAADQEKIAI